MQSISTYTTHIYRLINMQCVIEIHVDTQRLDIDIECIYVFSSARILPKPKNSLERVGTQDISF